MFSQLIKDLLNALPNMFTNTRETHSALGPALQAAFKLMSPTGGRVSVFQTQLPSLGAGLLQSREDPNQRSSTKVFYISFSVIFKIVSSTSIDCVIVCYFYFSTSLIVKKKINKTGFLFREFNSIIVLFLCCSVFFLLLCLQVIEI